MTQVSLLEDINPERDEKKKVSLFPSIPLPEAMILEYIERRDTKRSNQ